MAGAWRRRGRGPIGWLLAALLGLFATGGALPAAGQSASDMEVAQDFLALELAGWRLPDPVEACLTGLKLKHLEPMAYGSEDLIDQPVLVDPPGPHARISRIETEPGDPAQRVVQFDWLLPGPDGAPHPVHDSFTFGSGGTAGGRPVMLHEPDHRVIRRECFGG